MAPGVYFRMLLVGYFEGLASERGISWRCADSLSLWRFLRVGLDGGVPDHSTVSRTRRLIDVETHADVFHWMLERLAEKKATDGKTIGVDAMTLVANAAMRSIMRLDTGEGYHEFLKGRAKASGIEKPRREDLARLDRKRKKYDALSGPSDRLSRFRRAKPSSIPRSLSMSENPSNVVLWIQNKHC